MASWGRGLYTGAEGYERMCVSAYRPDYLGVVIHINDEYLWHWGGGLSQHWRIVRQQVSIESTKLKPRLSKYFNKAAVKMLISAILLHSHNLSIGSQLIVSAEHVFDYITQITHTHLYNDTTTSFGFYDCRSLSLKAWTICVCVCAFASSPYLPLPGHSADTHSKEPLVVIHGVTRATKNVTMRGRGETKREKFPQRWWRVFWV